MGRSGTPRKAKRDISRSRAHAVRGLVDVVGVDSPRSSRLRRLGPVALTASGTLAALLLIFGGLATLNRSVLPFDRWPLGTGREAAATSQTLPRVPKESVRLRTARGGTLAQVLDGRVVVAAAAAATGATPAGAPVVKVRVLHVAPQRTGSDSPTPPTPVPASPGVPAPANPVPAAPAPAPAATLDAPPARPHPEREGDKAPATVEASVPAVAAGPAVGHAAPIPTPAPVPAPDGGMPGKSDGGGKHCGGHGGPKHGDAPTPTVGAPSQAARAPGDRPGRGGRGRGH